MSTAVELEYESKRWGLVGSFNAARSNWMAQVIAGINLLFFAALALGLAASGNHIETEPRWLWIWPIGFGLTLLPFWWSGAFSRRDALMIAGSILLVACLLFVMDYYNLMDSYDVWAGRGMPGAWEHTPGGRI